MLSVGGTTLNLNSQGYLSESGWSGSGGGISAYEAQPSYQRGLVTQSTTRRTNPDVAYDANPSTGFPVYDSYNNPVSAPWSQWGGTSAGAPQWAALVAIADQGRALAGKTALDGATQTLPMLYALAAGDFHDVTSGTSTGSPRYSAGAGYDLVAGRGSPYANLVVGDLVGVSTATSVAAAVTTPSGPQTGDVAISYSLTDPMSGTWSIQVQYSADGGATWNNATPGDGGDGATGLTSSPGGTPHTFVWASGSDLGNTSNTNVKVRITPIGATAGATGTSGVFTVNNAITSTADWSIVGTGDFNGDGTADVLWQNQSTGALGAWIIKNGAYSRWVSLGTADPTVWKVAGVGDFNADGTADVLWQAQTTGTVVAWFIKNGAVSSYASLGGADPSVWKLAGVGDFNGDGAADVLWQNQSTGAVGAWIIKKGAYGGWASLGTADPTAWEIAGVGDFNGDRTSDVLWYNQTTGTVGAWIIKNGAYSSWASLGTADPTTWMVAGVGDFNGDGTSDVLWYSQSTGNVVDWLIKKGAVSGWASLGAADPTVWQLAGVGDFNADHAADVLWYDQSDGTVGAWIVKNGTSSTWAGLGVASQLTPHAAAAGDLASDAAPLSQVDLQPVIAEAIARWNVAGPAVSAVETLARVPSVLSDLPDSDLGEATPAARRVDRDVNAAGQGWSVDPALALAEDSASPRTDLLSQAVDPRRRSD